MRFLYRVGLLAVLAAACQLAGGWARAEEPLRLRVLSYNIHHAEGVDGKLDVERIARVVREARPDLVALQEVDRGARRTHQIDEPAVLADLTGMQYAFGDNVDLQPGRYGNAVLSRYPIERHTNHPLPRVNGGEPRGALEVEIELPDGYPRLVFLATHLDHRPDDAQRQASAQQLNQLASRYGGQLAVLAGDLNDRPTSPTLLELARHWKRANPDPLPTFPSSKPARQIDYILLLPDPRWTVIETLVLDESSASDHRPILAVLELHKEPRGGSASSPASGSSSPPAASSGGQESGSR